MLVLLLSLACSTANVSDTLAAPKTGGTQAAPALEPGQAAAVFAGGCFWCMEGPLEAVPGVISVHSGYTGGAELNPTYEDVGHHRTSHYEANRVVYDPTQVTYEQLLDVYWHNIDPTQSNGQFCDKGDQYRSAVFTDDADERAAFERTKAAAAETLGQDVVTELLPAAVFWVAEDYHQDFYKKNPGRYTSYRTGCGRDARLEQLWGPGAGH